MKPLRALLKEEFDGFAAGLSCVADCASAGLSTDAGAAAVSAAVKLRCGRAAGAVSGCKLGDGAACARGVVTWAMRFVSDERGASAESDSLLI